MSTIRSIVTHFLDNQAWSYHHMNDNEAITFNLNVDGRNHRLVFDIREEMSVLMLYVLHPEGVVEEKRSTIADYITRANYGLMLGNFEIDFADGDLRYKISIDVEGGELSEAIVMNMVQAALGSVNRHYSGLMAVQYGGLSAIAAYNRAMGLPEVSVCEFPGVEMQACAKLGVVN